MSDYFIFDLDGTLVDSEPIYIQAYMEAMAFKNVTLTQQQAFKIVHGHAWRDIYNTTMNLWPESWPIEDEAWDFVENRAVELCTQTDISISDSVTLLVELAKEYPVCVVSGSPRSKIQRNLTEIGVIDLVDFYLGSEDYSNGKPHPEPFLKAAEKWGVEAEKCTVFEDSPAGMKSGQAAGMEVVMIAAEDNHHTFPEGVQVFERLSEYLENDI